jgi:hypothetical protein
MAPPEFAIDSKVVDAMCFVHQAILQKIAFYYGASTRLIERTLSKAHKMSFVAYFGPKRREGNKTTKVNLSAGRKCCAKASVRLFFLVNWAH